MIDAQAGAGAIKLHGQTIGMQVDDISRSHEAIARLDPDARTRFDALCATSARKS